MLAPHLNTPAQPRGFISPTPICPLGLGLGVRALTTWLFPLPTCSVVGTWPAYASLPPGLGMDLGTKKVTLVFGPLDLFFKQWSPGKTSTS